MMYFESYRKIQHTAKEVHELLGDHIDSNSTEYSISNTAIELLNERGITDTWYHDVPAFVLLGSRSCISISGRNYQPSDETVGNTNLVIVDLSPMLGNVWGDCARSYFIENGVYTENPTSKDFIEGISTEKELHEKMISFVSRDVKFSELHQFGNDLITDMGYENLDFLGNLGHSIETEASNRRYIDKNCDETLGSVNFFTFEPHIRKIDGSWGFKHENIYYFNGEGHAVEL